MEGGWPSERREAPVLPAESEPARKRRRHHPVPFSAAAAADAVVADDGAQAGEAAHHSLAGESAAAPPPSQLSLSSVHQDHSCNDGQDDDDDVILVEPVRPTQSAPVRREDDPPLTSGGESRHLRPSDELRPPGPSPSPPPLEDVPWASNLQSLPPAAAAVVTEVEAAHSSRSPSSSAPDATHTLEALPSLDPTEPLPHSAPAALPSSRNCDAEDAEEVC